MDFKEYADQLVRKPNKLVKKKTSHKKKSTHCAACPTVQPNPPEQPPRESGQKTIEQIIEIAKRLWKAVIKRAKESKEFRELPDKQKLQYFRDAGNEEFMNEFPIVSRYMICMGQFKARALKRMLDKMSRHVDPPFEEQPKNYREDLFCRRQADYIRFLWEEYQAHPNPEESNFIWQDAYQRLKGEFDDFRDMYDETKKRIEDEKEKYKAQNARELLERLSTGLQQLPEDDSTELLELLKDKVYRRRYTTSMTELLAIVPEIPAVTEAFGQGPEEKAPLTEEEQRRTIRMIEHVDADRADEIPKELIVDPEQDPYLKKMRDIQNTAVEA